MKNIFLFLFSISLISFSACIKDVAAPTLTTTGNTNIVNFKALKTGTIIPQNGSNSSGTIELGVDSFSNHYLKLKSDFKSTFTNVTLIVSLSTTADFNENTSVSIGSVTASGEKYYNITLYQFNNATYFILYNTASNTQFGNAQIKPL